MCDNRNLHKDLLGYLGSSDEEFVYIYMYIYIYTIMKKDFTAYYRHIST